MFYRSQKVIQIWNIAVNKWWLNFNFCVIYPIKTEKRGTSLIIQQPTIKSQCSVNECSETTANVNWHVRRMPLVKGQCERLMLAVWSENSIKSSHKCHKSNPPTHAHTIYKCTREIHTHTHAIQAKASALLFLCSQMILKYCCTPYLMHNKSFELVFC